MSEPVHENPIHKRDGWRCCVHGDQAQTVHHRNHDHSDDRPSNRISTCGSGTTGAHGWVEAHPAEAGLAGEDGPGWTVTRHGPRLTGPAKRSRVDTTQIPVWMANGPYGQGWYLLTDDFGFWGWPGSVTTQPCGECGRFPHAPTCPAQDGDDNG
jgi:hypothetical protein